VRNNVHILRVKQVLCLNLMSKFWFILLVLLYSGVLKYVFTVVSHDSENFRSNFICNYIYDEELGSIESVMAFAMPIALSIIPLKIMELLVIVK
jgi:hypothetical protein